MHDLHPTIAALHRHDLLREAEEWRRARGSRRPTRPWHAGQLLRVALRSRVRARPSAA
jgi:hypothetical protein